MTDLGTLGDSRYGSYANGINNRGEIVGSSSTPTGQYAVLWTPGDGRSSGRSSL